MFRASQKLRPMAHEARMRAHLLQAQTNAAAGSVREHLTARAALLEKIGAVLQGDQLARLLLWLHKNPDYSGLAPAPASKSSAGGGSSASSGNSNTSAAASSFGGSGIERAAGMSMTTRSATAATGAGASYPNSSPRASPASSVSGGFTFGGAL